MFEDILESIRASGGQLSGADVLNLNPLVLAYIGDAVYEVFIRTAMIALEPNKSVHKLHLLSTSYVKAHAQACIVRRIAPSLSEKESNIVRRGRNSKSGYVPKNADVIEYREATGFEALIGYLYLTGNTKRLKEILCCSLAEETV